MLLRVCVFSQAASGSGGGSVLGLGLHRPENGGSVSSSLLAAWSRGQKPIIEVTIKAFSNQLAGKVSSFL